MQSTLLEQRSRFETHDQLIAAMNALTDDPLAATGSRMVIYRGNPSAELMVVGEGPGATEDEQGKPFVGKAGQLLDRILESAAFDSQNDVYVTNSVFRRPPNNRDPEPAELDYYRFYVHEIIRLIDPKIIMLTGKYALWQVLGGQRLGCDKVQQLRITQLRGKWHEVDGRWIMPVFHPAYLLRNQSRAEGSPKWLMWQDIQEIRRKYDEIVGTPAQGSLG